MTLFTGCNVATLGDYATLDVAVVAAEKFVGIFKARAGGKWFVMAPRA